MEIINWRLLANPINWVIIYMILFLCALLAQVVYTAATSGKTPLPLPSLGS